MSQYPPNNSQPPNWQQPWQGNQSQPSPPQPWGVPPDQSGQWGQPPPQWQGQQPPQPLQPNTGYQQPSGSQWPQQQAGMYPQQQYQQPPMMPPGPPPQPPRKKLSRRAWIIIGVVVLILVVASVANANKGGNTPTSVAPTATPTTIIVNSQATDTPIPTATPKPPPTAKPTPTFASFGDGTYQVGKDIQPGTYRTRSASTGCYYERLKGFSGGIDDILANDNTDDPAIVTILASDKGFDAQNCGTWTKDLSQITTSKTTFPDGMYFVGIDFIPGTYKNNGSTGCYYARLSNFTGGLNGIIANGNVDTPTIVTIAASDKGFQSKGCGTWTKI